MLSIKRRAWSGAVVLGLSASPLFGVATVSTSNQSVSVDLQGSVVDSQAAVAPGPFNGSASGMLGGDHVNNVSATQTSDVQPLLFSGVGEAFGETDGTADIGASSIYQMNFSLTQDHAYALDGTLTALLDGGHATAFFSLTGPSTNITFLASEIVSPTAITGNGTLGPGSYNLLVSAQTVGDLNGGNQFDRANFDFSVTLRELDGGAIPEPVTPVLAALGLGALGLRATRRRG
jgi:hypothetical protein